MNAVSDIPNIGIADSALGELLPQLLQLSANARLEIIARLAQSLRSAPSSPYLAEQEATLPTAVGAWANDPEAEKMEQAILSIRHSANEFEAK